MYAAKAASEASHSTPVVWRQRQHRSRTKLLSSERPSRQIAKKKTVTVAVSVSIWEFSRPGTTETRNARA
jgi:hypothetical protein